MTEPKDTQPRSPEISADELATLAKMALRSYANPTEVVSGIQTPAQLETFEHMMSQMKPHVTPTVEQPVTSLRKVS